MKPRGSQSSRSDKIKASVEKWIGSEIEDMEAEFDKIDTNAGGQVSSTIFFNLCIQKTKL